MEHCTAALGGPPPRFDPVIAAFAKRLGAAGKLPKVAIIACMRKLLTLLTPWPLTA